MAKVGARRRCSAISSGAGLDSEPAIGRPAGSLPPTAPAAARASGETNSPVVWSVAIFSSREDIETLSRSISAVIDATAATPAVIDVLVNGNRALAEATARFAESLGSRRLAKQILRVWYIALADKAHAWNQYVSEIWPGSDIAYFVDGYARVMPTSLTLISAALNADPHPLAASGVPTVGGSAKVLREQMLGEGGIHGNFYAIRGRVLAELRERCFRLPLGTYWTDGLVGAVICFGLDSAKHKWDTTRILVHPEATWAVRPMAWWRISDVAGQLKRMLRQAQGRLENLAFREHLDMQRKAPEILPRTAAELVEGWLGRFPWTARAMFLRDPLCVIAARRLRRPRDWSQTAVPPLLASDRHDPHDSHRSR